MGRKTDRMIDRLRNIQTERQIYRQTNRQTEQSPVKQVQTDRQKEWQTYIYNLLKN